MLVDEWLQVRSCIQSNAAIGSSIQPDSSVCEPGQPEKDSPAESSHKSAMLVVAGPHQDFRLSA
jgi:hypothetical protein